MIGKAPGAIKAKGIVEIIDRTGKLVYRSRDRKLLKKYEQWRCSWTTQVDNRKLWMPSGFREGKMSPFIILFWLYLRMCRQSIYRRLTNNG
jgi:hypothetical protein